MDTGTHIAMGVALGGLATIDPAVSQDPALFQAVLAGTIIGSHAPDFDTVFKFKSNASYIKFHRGFSHSIPMIFFWGLVISAAIYAFSPQIIFLHLLGWTTLAVALHVLVDIFNAYGTQALRPFSKRWLALGFINTFDPYIFFLHIGGIVAWILGANPASTWLTIYLVIVLYYIKRYLDKREIVREIYNHFPDAKRISTSPTVKQNEWRVAFCAEGFYYVGVVINGHIQIIDMFEHLDLPDSSLMKIARQDENISAFLDFSPLYRWEMEEIGPYNEVRLIDLRYRYDGHYPFVAVAHINRDGQIINSYTGWVFSEHKLQEKLYVGDSFI